MERVAASSNSGQSRGLQIFDSEWWPEPSRETGLEDAKVELRQVLQKFVMATAPLKVRDEIGKEQMTRDFRISDASKGLRCLMKGGYVRIVLQAGSKEYYVLDRSKLGELIQFMRDGVGLESVLECIVK